MAEALRLSLKSLTLIPENEKHSDSRCRNMLHRETEAYHTLKFSKSIDKVKEHHPTILMNSEDIDMQNSENLSPIIENNMYVQDCSTATVSPIIEHSSLSPLKVESSSRSSITTPTNEIMSDIIILPRGQSTNLLRHDMCINDSVLSSVPHSLNVDLRGVPFVPDGLHRIWQGDKLFPWKTFPSQLSNNSDTLSNPCTSQRNMSVSIQENPISSIMKPVKIPYETNWFDYFASFPRIGNAYLYFFFNMSVVLACMYSVWYFISSLRQDVITKIMHHSRQLAINAQLCKDNFNRNRCQRDLRVPALENVCNEWELCMAAEPSGTAKRAALSAETLGFVINSFLEQLTWKSILILSLTLIIIIISTYFILQLGRLWFPLPTTLSSTKLSSCNAECCCRDVSGQIKTVQPQEMHKKHLDNHFR